MIVYLIDREAKQSVQDTKKNGLDSHPEIEHRNSAFESYKKPGINTNMNHNHQDSKTGPQQRWVLNKLSYVNHEQITGHAAATVFFAWTIIFTRTNLTVCEIQGSPILLNVYADT